MAFNYSPKIITDGLVLYLDAANTRSYPTTGTIWSDLSRNNNNGTLINGPTFNSSNGGSIVFDGVNDYVDCGSSTNLNFGIFNYTLNVWFRTNTNTRRTILSRFDYDGIGVIERGYYIDVLSTGKIRTAFETNGNNFRITDSLTSVNTNSYFYVTAVRTNQTTISVYVNGTFETSNTLINGTPTNINTVTAPFSVGLRSDYQTPTFTNYFVGSVANVKIYNKALSAQEVLQNFNATKSRFGLT